MGNAAFGKFIGKHAAGVNRNSVCHGASKSMVVDDFNILCFLISPAETDPIATVYPDAVLASAVADEFFQSTAGQCCQIVHASAACRRANLMRAFACRIVGNN